MFERCKSGIGEASDCVARMIEARANKQGQSSCGEAA